MSFDRLSGISMQPKETTFSRTSDSSRPVWWISDYFGVQTTGIWPAQTCNSASADRQSTKLWSQVCNPMIVSRNSVPHKREVIWSGVDTVGAGWTSNNSKQIMFKNWIKNESRVIICSKQRNSRSKTYWLNLSLISPLHMCKMLFWVAIQIIQQNSYLITSCKPQSSLAYDWSGTVNHLYICLNE